mmetsp:Transcript_78527/g.234037  ORF Transcript_78527/g.234037 Transcript_78527/m.234037 type:complete len:260 (+) Transcript_78527:597-1376(+)
MSFRRSATSCWLNRCIRRSRTQWPRRTTREFWPRMGGFTTICSRSCRTQRRMTGKCPWGTMMRHGPSSRSTGPRVLRWRTPYIVSPRRAGCRGRTRTAASPIAQLGRLVAREQAPPVRSQAPYDNRTGKPNRIGQVLARHCRSRGSRSPSSSWRCPGDPSPLARMVRCKCAAASTNSANPHRVPRAPGASSRLRRAAWAPAPARGRLRPPAQLVCATSLLGRFVVPGFLALAAGRLRPLAARSCRRAVRARPIPTAAAA